MTAGAASIHPDDKPTLEQISDDVVTVNSDQEFLNRLLYSNDLREDQVHLNEAAVFNCKPLS